MNRKERRAAKKQARSSGGVPAGALGASPGMQIFAEAFRHFSAGQMQEAERLCRDVLSFDGDHFDSLHLLGIVALRTGRPEQAVAWLGRALSADARAPECHSNLAQALRACGRLDEAAAHLRQAIALRRGHAATHASLGEVRAQQHRDEEAQASFHSALAIDPALVEGHYGLGNLMMREGRFEEAAARYRRVLAARPEAAEAHSNLGVALAALGRPEDAATHYRRALAFKPQLADVWRNLARLQLAHGNTGEAFALARRALALGDTQENRVFFLQCAARLPSPPEDGEARDSLAGLIARALEHGWTRPSEIAALAAMLIRLGPAGTCIARAAAAWPHRLAWKELWSAPEELAATLTNPLLQALLGTTPVQDADFERFLTGARAALLALARAGDHADADFSSAHVAFFSALAQQCFLNEYVFDVSVEEVRQLAELRQKIEAALVADADVPALWLIALAAYAPLSMLANPDLLVARTWPPAILGMIHRQVNDFKQEARLRSELASLTPISDEVSIAVRRQYEEAPYPRWLKPAPAGQPSSIAWYLRNQFPQAPIAGTSARASLDVLIAGCGTGQHAIETAQRFAGAKVLAVDLSLASLAYAARMAAVLDIGNMEFAQADILELGSIGRSFDLVEASGVLHHMRDPGQGLRVLTALLRPGGFMHLGLYSAAARGDVRAARAFIAERGWRAIPESIRQCRQEILGLPDDHPAKPVAGYSDFYTMSECRDLLFHVQEHQLAIPQIKSLLGENGLIFIGFAGPPAPAYRAQFPGDPAMVDLDRWHLIEQEQPKLFVNMYELWAQKP